MSNFTLLEVVSSSALPIRLTTAASSQGILFRPTYLLQPCHSVSTTIGTLNQAAQLLGPAVPVYTAQARIGVVVPNHHSCNNVGEFIVHYFKPGDVVDLGVFSINETAPSPAAIHLSYHVIH